MLRHQRVNAFAVGNGQQLLTGSMNGWIRQRCKALSERKPTHARKKFSLLCIDRCCITATQFHAAFPGELRVFISFIQVFVRTAVTAADLFLVEGSRVGKIEEENRGQMLVVLLGSCSIRFIPRVTIIDHSKSLTLTFYLNLNLIWKLDWMDGFIHSIRRRIKE